MFHPLSLTMNTSLFAVPHIHLAIPPSNHPFTRLNFWLHFNRSGHLNFKSLQYLQSLERAVTQNGRHATTGKVGKAAAWTGSDTSSDRFGFEPPPPWHQGSEPLSSQKQ